MNKLIKHIKTVIIILTVINSAQLITCIYLNLMTYSIGLLSVLLEFVFLLTYLFVIIYSKWINEQLAESKLNHFKLVDQIDSVKEKIQNDLQLARIQLSDHVSKSNEEREVLKSLIESNQEKTTDQIITIKNELSEKLTQFENTVQENKTRLDDKLNQLQIENKELISQSISSHLELKETISTLKNETNVKLELLEQLLNDNKALQFDKLGQLEVKNENTQVAITNLKSLLTDLLGKLENELSTSFTESRIAKKILEEKLIELGESTISIISQLNNHKNGLEAKLNENRNTIILELNSKEEENVNRLSDLKTILFDQNLELKKALGTISDWNNTFEDKLGEEIQSLIQNYTSTTALINDAKLQLIELVENSKEEQINGVKLFISELPLIKDAIEVILKAETKLIADQQHKLGESVLLRHQDIEKQLKEGVLSLIEKQVKLQDYISESTSSNSKSIVEGVRIHLEKEIYSTAQLMQSLGTELKDKIGFTGEFIEHKLEEKTKGLSKEQAAQIEQLIALEKSIEVSITNSINRESKELSSTYSLNTQMLVSLINKLTQLNKELFEANSELGSNQQKALSLSSDINKNLESLPIEIQRGIENQTQHFDYNLVKQNNIIYDRIDALLSIHGQIKLNAPLPIMHDWRVSSDYAHTLLSTILSKAKGSVIDIGSGISTIIFGYAVKQNGTGNVIALEHSKEYFDKTKQLIKEHQLEKFCTVCYCPLIKYKLNGEEWLWYDIKDVNFPTEINVVSIDGPPGDTQHLARYPALPLLKKYLNKNTVLYLDDSNRTEEQEISEKWIKEFGYKFEHNKNHKGTIKLFV